MGSGACTQGTRNVCRTTGKGGSWEGEPRIYKAGQAIKSLVQTFGFLNEEEEWELTECIY